MRNADAGVSLLHAEAQLCPSPTTCGRADNNYFFSAPAGDALVSPSLQSSSPLSGSSLPPPPPLQAATSSPTYASPPAKGMNKAAKRFCELDLWRDGESDDGSSLLLSLPLCMSQQWSSTPLSCSHHPHNHHRLRPRRHYSLCRHHCPYRASPSTFPARLGSLPREWRKRYHDPMFYHCCFSHHK